MNREERRAAAKKPKKKNPHDPNKIIQFERALKFAKNSVKDHTEAIEFAEGDKVKINIDAVKARKNWIHMTEEYKKFVEANEDTVFSVHLEEGMGSKVVSFQEDSRWLFWSGDLVRLG